ncbi:hypothetical protein I302_105924 [Kwoniella bestiolae CBS 10118]|uniref:Uncharacterized protein n=1 Tax=Kwoniella bestiolae CBS 10118 TaxID=1296100 RepID=A0A1B9G2J2_9TREE|nr:hypothetical protein I302_05048 [Kwoniella bestiolae CBS 10118]OCF25235.1 hypothetical protein I302_05048 [Kwoniella bestiolae CBS 10118]
MIIPLDPPKALYDFFASSPPKPKSGGHSDSTPTKFDIFNSPRAFPTSTPSSFHVGQPGKTIFTDSSRRHIGKYLPRAQGTNGNRRTSSGSSGVRSLSSSSSGITHPLPVRSTKDHDVILLREDPWAPRKEVERDGVEMDQVDVVVEDEMDIPLVGSSQLESRASPSIISLKQALSRLCGIFSPSPLFHNALKTLSSLVGISENYPWYYYHDRLDEVFHRSFALLLDSYDDTQYISPYYHALMEDTKLIRKFTPPDVLWMLVQTSDQQILDSLYRVIKVHLSKCRSKNTQRGVALLVLLKKVQETRWRKFRGWKAFAEALGLCFVQSGGVLEEEIGLPRVRAEDIRMVLENSVGWNRKRRRDGMEYEEGRWGSKRMRL